MQIRVKITTTAFCIEEEAVFMVGKREPATYIYSVNYGWDNASDIPHSRLSSNYEYIYSAIRHSGIPGPNAKIFETMLIWELDEAVGDVGEW